MKWIYSARKVNVIYERVHLQCILYENIILNDKFIRSDKSNGRTAEQQFPRSNSILESLPVKFTRVPFRWNESTVCPREGRVTDPSEESHSAIKMDLAAFRG